MKSSQTTAAPKPSADHSRRNRRIALIVLLTILIGAIAGGLYWLHRTLFVTNPRLVLRQIELHNVTGGYWEEHKTELFHDLGLLPGKSFHDIHADVLRQQLLAYPNIADVEVEILQPDTIRLNVTERVPVAVLDTQWVVDADGFILRRDRTIAKKLTLPVIREMRRQQYWWYYQRHIPRTELNGALQLCAAIQNYPTLKLQMVVVRSDKKLEAQASYMGQPACRIIFPAGQLEKTYRNLVDRFFDAITETRRNGDMRTSFDLSFDGRIIIR